MELQRRFLPEGSGADDARLGAEEAITGSFNFTKAAEGSNAENLLVIRDAALAGRYLLAIFRINDTCPENTYSFISQISPRPSYNRLKR